MKKWCRYCKIINFQLLDYSEVNMDPEKWKYGFCFLNFFVIHCNQMNLHLHSAFFLLLLLITSSFFLSFFRIWFTDAATLILEKMQPNSAVIFYQSDVKVLDKQKSNCTEWIDKAHLCRKY